MDYIFGAFALPMVLWATLSWWVLVIILLGLIVTETVFYNESHFTSFFVLLMVFVFTVYMMSDAEGIWDTIWAVVAGTSWAMLQYVILGMFATVPLWLWTVRKFYTELRGKLTEYIKIMATHDGKNDLAERFGAPLSDADREICKKYVSGNEIPAVLKSRWKDYRLDILHVKEGEMRVANNPDLVTSMIFLWPFHIVTLLFGDLLAEIPKLFVKFFGKMLDRLSSIARLGIPKGIDED